MAPYYSARDVVHPLSAADVQSVDKNLTSSSQLTHQWSNPNDILSLLLLVGPNIVQKALAQLAGGRISPVAFSFGWVAYSISALFSTLGGKAAHKRHDCVIGLIHNT